MTNALICRLLVAGLTVGQISVAAAQSTDGPPTPAVPSVGAVGEPPLVEQVEAVLADPLAVAVGAAVEAARAGARTAVEKRRAEALAVYYAGRGNRPVWIADGEPTPAATAVAERLADAAADGLDPGAYAVPLPALAAAPSDLAGFDVALSRAVAAFAEDASGGRLVPNAISPKFITRKPDRIAAAAALHRVTAAPDPAAELDAFNPPHEAFRRLKAMLAEVRGRVPVAQPDPIPGGKSLKPGMRDPRVVLLRDRLGVPAPVAPAPLPAAATDLPGPGAPAMVAEPESIGAAGVVTTASLPSPDADLYDDELVRAVKDFQSSTGLLADGVVGPRTVAVLNGVDRDEEGQIVANMEMWRWMPRDLGAEHVFVNIPEFVVRVVRHGVQTHEARVVVGTQTNQTPVFSDEMEYLVVNPYWHVPESIRLKEMLPEIKADPAGFFRRHGYEAVWNGQVIDPTRVVWDENAVKFVGIRQPPSERNALGRIKFMFPNQHAVYLHDTPSRKLFQRDWRAYSHGCVRVDDPMEFARAILEGEPDIDVPRLESMFGGQERRVDLTQHIRVHLAYFNVWVDDAGVLQMRDDLYGHVARVKAALEKTVTAVN